MYFDLTFLPIVKFVKKKKKGKLPQIFYEILIYLTF